MKNQYTQNPHNQIRGAQNRAQGNIFERIIDSACTDYRQAGFAEIEKTPEPMQPIRNMGQGQFIAHFAKKAQPDYKDTLRGGKSIVIEAKHTDGDRIKQDRVTPEQTEALNRHYELGALCFVLVSIRMNLFAMIPWPVWERMKLHFGRKYMTEQDIARYKVPFNGRSVLFLNGLTYAETYRGGGNDATGHRIPSD